MPQLRSGWLKKKSPSTFAALQSRFFVLSSDGLLSYFKNEQDAEPKGVIPIAQLISVKASGNAFDIDVGYRRFHLVASTSLEAEEWMAAIHGVHKVPPNSIQPLSTIKGHNAAHVAHASNHQRPVSSGGGASLTTDALSLASGPPVEGSAQGFDLEGCVNVNGGHAKSNHGTVPTSTCLPSTPSVATTSTTSKNNEKSHNCSMQELRPGVLMEGYLLKSPPQLSVRRMTEETRLQQRWFLLSNRSLQWFADATVSKPLSSVPLKLITQCEPKRGGKHPGKFYLRTDYRLLKMVAADAAAMLEWVDAINRARASLPDLRETSSIEMSNRTSIGHADDASGAFEAPECFQAWNCASLSGGQALDELAMNITQRVSEEFAMATGSDVDAILEAADRCAEQMCGVLDDVLSYRTVHKSEQADAAFIWHLGRYHGSIFAHLGGFFLNEEALAPMDALNLFCWVHGYHGQLGRLQVDAATLAPSLSELATDLIAASALEFGKRLGCMPISEAMRCELPMSLTISGKAQSERNSAHEATLQLGVHKHVLAYLRSAEEGLQAAPTPLSEVVVRAVPEIRNALSGVHQKLISTLASGDLPVADMNRREFVTSALDSADKLHELLRKLKHLLHMDSRALEVIDDLLLDLCTVMKAIASPLLAVYTQQPKAAKALQILFTSEWVSNENTVLKDILEAADVSVVCTPPPCSTLNKCMCSSYPERLLHCRDVSWGWPERSDLQLYHKLPCSFVLLPSGCICLLY